MICDICNGSLPFEDYAESKKIEITSEDNTLVSIIGNMPRNTNAKVNNISIEEAYAIAKKYKDISIEDVLYAYDISLDIGIRKYQPAEYNQFVNVELSNIELDLNKEYVMLHILDEENYEIIPIKKIGNEKIRFNATRFSTYILITVEGHTVTFNGENYKVYDIEGNEITDGATIASGTDFRFTIDPNNEYGVTDVTCVNSSSESVVEVSGYLKMKTGIIASVTEDLTIDVTTVIAPQITVQPVSTKVKVGSSVKFTIQAENATTYQWQYRDNRDTYWTSLSTTNSTTGTATLTVTAAGALSGREYRCLVGNTNFTNHERVESDIVVMSVTDDEIIEQATIINDEGILPPVIIAQPVSTKVKVGSSAKFTIQAENATTYQWQYRDSRDVYWTSLSTTNSTTGTATLTVTAAAGISGREYRCLVGNSGFVLHSRPKSDIVTISVADDEITESVTYYNIEITKQPESQKIKLGETAIFKIEETGSNKYQWQYKTSNDAEEWLNVDATLGTTNTIASGFNTATLSIDTSNMILDEDTLTISNNLSGYVFRCVITSSTLSRVFENSDAAFLSVTQDNILEDSIMVKTQPTLEAPSPVTLSVEGSTDIELEYVGDGTLSVVSSDETIATASIIGNIMRIRGIRTGTARLTLMASAGQEYGSSSTTIEVTVNEKQLMTDVIATNYEDVYDGATHGITLSGSNLIGATVTYGTTLGNYNLTEAPTYIDVGNYTVYFKVSKAGYEDYERSASVIINKKPVKVVWGKLNLTYNGTQQTPTATIDSGVPGETIKISITGYGVDVGTYRAKAKIESVEGGQGKITNYVLEKS